MIFSGFMPVCSPFKPWGRLLDASPTAAHVLGDTPIPQSDLRRGFSVPLSRSLAVLAVPTSTPQVVLDGCAVSAAEGALINRTQNENAL